MSDLPLRLGYAAATRMAAGDPELDDIAQEAALAVAQVAEEKPDAPVAYLGGVARMRCRKLLSEGRVWTGYEAVRGRPVDPLRSGKAASLDASEGHTEPAAPDELEAVEWGTLRPEIEAAIASIPARGRAVTRRVARGVYTGLSPSEAGRRAGVSGGAGCAAWGAARAHLRTQLSHLEELVA